MLLNEDYFVLDVTVNDMADTVGGFHWGVTQKGNPLAVDRDTITRNSSIAVDRDTITRGLGIQNKLSLGKLGFAPDNI